MATWNGSVWSGQGPGGSGGGPGRSLVTTSTVATTSTAATAAPAVTTAPTVSTAAGMTRPWSGQLPSTVLGGDQKTKFICCFLKRTKGSETSYALSNKEKARLIFRQLKLPRDNGMVIGYCEKLPRCFRIVVNERLEIERYLPAHELEIRRGLTVMPMKERKSEVVVEISRIPYETPAEEIKKTMALFGKIKEIRHKKATALSENEARDDDIKLLVGLKTGVREVEMEVHRNIPSFVMIDGRKAKSWYRGQEWFCQNCLKSHKKCPSGGDKEKCKKEKNPTMTFEVMWEKVLADTGARLRMGSQEEYETDTLKIDCLPEGVSHSEIVKWFKDNASVYILENQLFREEVPEGHKPVWFLNGLESRMMKQILSVLHGLEWDPDDSASRIYLQPFKEATPVKDTRQIQREYQLPPQPPKTSDSQIVILPEFGEDGQRLMNLDPNAQEYVAQYPPLGFRRTPLVPGKVGGGQTPGQRNVREEDVTHFEGSQVHLTETESRTLVTPPPQHNSTLVNDTSPVLRPEKVLGNVMGRASNILRGWGWGKSSKGSSSGEGDRPVVQQPGVPASVSPSTEVEGNAGKEQEEINEELEEVDLNQVSIVEELETSGSDPLSHSKVGDFSSTRRSHTSHLDTATLIVDEASLEESNVGNETIDKIETEMLLLDTIAEYFSPNTAVNESQKKGKKKLKKSMLAAAQDDKNQGDVFQETARSPPGGVFQVPAQPPKPKRLGRPKKGSQISPIRSRSESQKRKADEGPKLGRCTCVEFPDFVCPIYEHQIKPDDDKESLNSTNCDDDGNDDVDDFKLVGRGGKPIKRPKKQRKGL